MDPETLTAATPQESQAPPQPESQKASETPAEGGTPTEQRPASSAGGATPRKAPGVNLEDLSEEALAKWKKSGKLPLEVEPREKTLTPDELDPLLKLTREERDEWAESGELPERLLPEKAETEKPAPAKEPEFVPYGQPISEKDHESSFKTLPARIARQRDLAGDGGEVMAKLGTLPAVKGLEDFMLHTLTHAVHPYAAIKHFAQDSDFRNKVESAFRAGNTNETFSLFRGFDHSYREPAKRPRIPAPATSISGKATAPVDEENSALSKGDVSAYFEAANRADIARSKAKR